MKQSPLKGQRDACVLHWQELQRRMGKISIPALTGVPEILEYKKKFRAFYCLVVNTKWTRRLRAYEKQVLSRFVAALVVPPTWLE